MRALFAIALILIAAPALADINDSPAPPIPPPTPCAMDPMAPEWMAHKPKISLAIGPAWEHVLRDNYRAAFVNNGFNSPGRDRIGLDLLAYFTTESRWQLGIGLTSFSLEQTTGTSAADYSNGLFGVYLARNFSRDPDTDITLGTILGWNRADLTVFSGNQNGRLEETAAVVAPSIGYAMHVCRMLKIGLRASYAIPFGESTNATGNSLGVTKIGTRGFSLALQGIFGR